MLCLGPFGFDVLIKKEDGSGGFGADGWVECGEGFVADWPGIFCYY